MSDFFGEFSWPRLTVDLPVYVASAATVALAIIAYVQIRLQRHEASSRAALETLMTEHTTGDWMDVRDRYVDLRRSGDLSQFGYNFSELPKEQLHTIRKVLNRYELVSVGILTHAYDEQTYKRFGRTMFVNDYIELMPFVAWVRGTSPLAYLDAEMIVSRWATADEKAKIGTQLNMMPDGCCSRFSPEILKHRTEATQLESPIEK